MTSQSNVCQNNEPGCGRLKQMLSELLEKARSIEHRLNRVLDGDGGTVDP